MFSSIRMRLIFAFYMVVLPGMATAGPAQERARQMCVGTGNQSDQTLLDFDEGTLCRLKVNSPYPRVKRMASQIFEIVSHMEPSEDQFTNRNLQRKLAQLSELINSENRRARGQDFRTPPANPGATILADLESLYGTGNQRRRGLRSDVQKKNYVRELLELAKTTPTGAAILECYKNNNSGLINPVSDFVDTIRFQEGNGDAQFRPEEAAPGSARAFNATFTISGIEKNTPTGQLELILHEMQHGCNGDLHARNISRLMTCTHQLEERNIPVPETLPPELTTPDARDYAEAEADYHRDAGVDELLAYGNSAKAMLELSAQWPEYFCSRAATDLFSPELRMGSLPSVWGEAVDGLSEGTEFFEKIMYRYVENQNLYAPYIYSFDGSGRIQRDAATGRPSLAPAVLARVREMRSGR